LSSDFQPSDSILMIIKSLAVWTECIWTISYCLQLQSVRFH